MLNRIFRSRSYLEHAYCSGGPGLTAFIGYFGYIFLEVLEGNRNDKRLREVYEEFNRREKLFYEENKEIIKLLEEAHANRRHW
ncbi:hypothetical protein ISN45_Aa03g005440 [Arabidopsis thaliana x Arabidopsis arenosa]|uniref:Transmembrane protein n=1 Tax=Arabidopsis thaliana x Arabidopsis arenosa TaxID=1240361 RepID=A0A8T2APL8_9BRAS|nr:hypothetical protein ISN45_Aa03g005440 [Arabidopsis thaliana x Arabidopsis arenosa]